MTTDADAVPDLDAEDVARWLAANPDFLARRPDLVAKLDPPDRGGDGVIDLQRAMVDKHRRELSELKRNWQELLAISRVNMSSQATIFEATLSAIRAASFEALIETIAYRRQAALDGTAELSHGTFERIRQLFACRLCALRLSLALTSFERAGATVDLLRVFGKRAV